MEQPFDESGAFIGMFLIIIFAVLFVIITIVKFIIRSIGLYILAKKTNHNKDKFFAFFPVSQNFLFGYIVKILRNPIKRKDVFNYMHILRTVSVSFYILTIFVYMQIFTSITDYNWIPFATVITVVIIFTIVTDMVCLYGLLKWYYKERSSLIIFHLFLSLVLPLYSGAILLYAAVKAKSDLQRPMDQLNHGGATT